MSNGQKRMTLCTYYSSPKKKKVKTSDYMDGVHGSSRRTVTNYLEITCRSVSKTVHTKNSPFHR